MARDCGAHASEAEVQRLVDEETFKRYKRFSRMQQDRSHGLRSSGAQVWVVALMGRKVADRRGAM